MDTNTQGSMKTIRNMEMGSFCGLMDDVMMANGKTVRGMATVNTLLLKAMWANTARASDMEMVSLSGLMASDIQDSSAVVRFMEVL
mmetsp:Transcript_102754/g.162486  ORF Transcript_102754/g.162486 Transcript_102754/m.162486 type:complete len:86 (+) Transcript_102754:212-469(+)